MKILKESADLTDEFLKILDKNVWNPQDEDGISIEAVIEKFAETISIFFEDYLEMRKKAEKNYFQDYNSSVFSQFKSINDLKKQLAKELRDWKLL